MKNKLLGSIEAGGTKFVCAVANMSFEVVEQVQFSTTTPQKTLAKTIAFFKKFDLAALSVGSFGPIDVIKESSTYGYVLSTPKKGWENFDFVGTLNVSLDVPIYFTTDVNASAYGEYLKIADVSQQSIVYYTIGTGIGGGVIQNGQFIGGTGHAEMGHISMKKHCDDESFDGVCSYHQDCLEGLASGPSILERTAISGDSLPENHEVWNRLAYYIAQACYSATLTLAPHKIILGGGVMSTSGLIEKIRKQFEMINQKYVNTPPLEEYISLPVIRNNGSATLGNFALAKLLVE